MSDYPSLYVHGNREFTNNPTRNNFRSPLELTEITARVCPRAGHSIRDIFSDIDGKQYKSSDNSKQKVIGFSSLSTSNTETPKYRTCDCVKLIESILTAKNQSNDSSFVTLLSHSKLTYKTKYRY